MSYCDWSKSSENNTRYHDNEWGIPLHDDKKQFEFLMLEAMQCGLNWQIILNKRDILRKCFDNFDYDKIAEYNEDNISNILNTEGMIKSQAKVRAIINNARCFQKIRKEYGSFDKYLWGYTKGKTVIYNHHGDGYIPTNNGLSDEISRDLRKRGFKYLGTITIYSHLQACGIINDHDKKCPRYQYILKNFPTVIKKRFKEENIHFFGKK